MYGDCYLSIYVWMVLVGEPSQHAHTIDDPHLLLAFFSPSVATTTTSTRVNCS